MIGDNMDMYNNYGMNPLGNNFNRMMNNGYGGYMPPAPRYEITEVNGEAGAQNFRMAPNSRTLLLDNTAAIVWLAQTDGAGYLTVTPFDLLPHQQVPPVDINNLAARVQQLEELINDKSKSNTFSNKQSKKQQHANATANTEQSATGSAAN